MGIKIRIIYFNIFVALVSIVLSLVFGEVIVRAFHLSKTYSSYPWQVEQEKWYLDYNPKKNSHGWRDREYSQDKKTGIFRIACIGDSVTEGYRVKLQNTFSKLLESGLKQAGYSIEVMNLGSCGNATKENLLTLEKAMEFHPDLIIYQFGLNDIEEFPYYKESKEGFSGPSPSIKIKRKFDFKSILRHSALYYALAERYNYLKLRMGYKNWSFKEWNASDEVWGKEFNRFQSVLSKISKSTKIIFLNMPYDFQVYSSSPEVDIPAIKWRKFCQDNGYGFLDFTTIFKQQNGIYNIFLDDCHLSNRGHMIVANYLGNYILDRYLPKNNN